MVKQQTVEIPALLTEAKAKKQTWHSYLLPESSPVELIVAAFLMLLVWVGTRLWWGFAPAIIVPVIMGTYAASLLRRSDFLLVSAIAGLVAVWGFPLGSNKPLIGPEVAITFPVPANAELWTIAIAVIVIYASAMISHAALVNRLKEKLVYLLLGLILFGYVAHGLVSQTTPSPQASFRDAVNVKPEPEKYGWDGNYYLRIFYLMEDGQGFYDALPKAFVEDSRMTTVPGSVFGWRLPTIFYVWKFLFGSGGGMAIGFIFMSAVTALLGFFVAKELSSAKLALPAAALICGYMFAGAVSMWMPFMEYWGLPFIFLAALLFLRGKSAYAAIPALIAPLVRELYAVVIAAGFIGDLIGSRWKSLIPWAVAGLGFGVIYFAHYSTVRSIAANASLAMTWAADGGWELIKNSISFFTTYLFSGPPQAIAFWGVGILGLLCVKSLPRKAFLLSIALALPIIMWFYAGQGAWYWGIAFTPVAYLGFAPLAGICLAFDKGKELTLARLGVSIQSSWNSSLQRRTARKACEAPPVKSGEELAKSVSENRLLAALGIILACIGTAGMLTQIAGLYFSRIPIQPLVFQIMNAFLVAGIVLVLIARKAQ